MHGLLKIPRFTMNVARRAAFPDSQLFLSVHNSRYAIETGAGLRRSSLSELGEWEVGSLYDFRIV